MSQHPGNLILRFFLEFAALVVIVQWGWATGQGAWRYLLAFGLPLLFALLWFTFTVPSDRPNGRAPVPVSGRARLVLEAALFLFAVWTCFARGQGTTGLALIFALGLHYLWSADRVVRLWRGA